MQRGSATAEGYILVQRTHTLTRTDAVHGACTGGMLMPTAIVFEAFTQRLKAFTHWSIVCWGVEQALVQTQQAHRGEA